MYNIKSFFEKRLLDHLIMSNCFWCSTPVDSDDFVECYFCTHKFHAIKCGNVTKDVCESIKTMKNIKFFCDSCLDSNLTPMVAKKFDKLTATIENVVKKGEVYDELVKKIDNLTSEMAVMKNVVNSGVSSALTLGTPVKKLRDGSVKRRISDAYGHRDSYDDVFPAFKKKRGEDKAIQGTSENVSTIKIVESSEYFHVSRFNPETETEAMKTWMAGILNNTDITCVKLLSKNRKLEDLSFVSFKLGVSKSLAHAVLDPIIWPKNVTVKPFEDRPYSSAKNFRLPLVGNL